MKKNITLRIDAALLKRSKHAALENDQSVSEWVANLIAKALVDNELFNSQKRQAFKFMDTGFSLGAKPLSRDETHER